MDRPHDRDRAPNDQPVLDLANLAEIALWLASAAASGALGNAAYDALKTVRRRFGPKRVDELKKKVYRELKRVKRKPGVSDQDLRLRVDRVFSESEDR